MAPAPPIVPVPRDGSLPLSFAQQRLWFLDQLSPGNVAFNIAGGVRLEGALDRPALAAAVNGVVRRHEILRTAFPALAGVPVQAVAPPAPVPLPAIDLSALPEAARRERLLAIGETGARTPFDLARGPLLRLLLIAEGGGHHTLLFILHHIVTDGWSMSILVREIAALYSAAVGGEAAFLRELPVQYGDFAAWQRRWLAGEALEAQLAYWRRQLAGAPAVLPLPTDRPRPDEQTFAGRSLPLSLRGVSLPALRRLALGNGVTPFMLLFAGFQVLLRGLTGEEDIVVGTDVANRNRGETEGLIGFFINQLPLRVSTAGNPTFRELISRVREVALGAYAHQDLPFEKMVDALKLDRQLRYSPVFQVKLFLLNTPVAALELPGLKITPLELEKGTANLDLTVALRESGDALTGWVNYRTDLFDAATISRLLKSFEALLARVLTDPDLAVDDLSRFISHSERTQLAMEDRARQESNLQRFKQIRPKAVHVPQSEVVRMETLHPDRDILLVVRPTVDDLDLADWARGNRELIEEKLQRHGAILFRGFAVEAPADFESFAQQICPVLYQENSEHVRENVSGSLYTPTPYPADQQLLWHNENSFNHRWPMKIMFCCMKAPEQGGETPIVDSREVYARIAPEIRASFEDRRILYMRNYRQGLGLDWQTVFRTTDRAAVEERAREERLDLEWKADDSLCTRALRPAVIRHPRTGSASWFNQAQHWHVSCLDPETRRSVAALFAEGDLPRNCYFGDGSVIPDDSLREILDVYRELEVSVPWQKGDVMLVDNVLAAHGRNPFVGERKLLVAMGDMVAFDEI
jgi:alpha-ketoglutarate-dependent taurine dioxygenase